jgi:hypothetical protein
MAYRVVYKGADVFCDTPQDVDALLTGATAHRGSGRKRPEKRPKTIRGWAKATTGKQRELLTILAISHPVSQSDSEIREKLALGSNRKIAGLMIGLSKSATRSGFSLDMLIAKEATRNGTGERHYRYGISPAVIPDIKEGIGLEN